MILIWVRAGQSTITTSVQCIQASSDDPSTAGDECCILELDNGARQDASAVTPGATSVILAHHQTSARLHMMRAYTVDQEIGASTQVKAHELEVPDPLRSDSSTTAVCIDDGQGVVLMLDSKGKLWTIPYT